MTTGRQGGGSTNDDLDRLGSRSSLWQGLKALLYKGKEPGTVFVAPGASAPGGQVIHTL